MSRHPSTSSRAIWAASEPFLLGMFFTAEVYESLAARGVSQLGTYVVARSAPLGRADPSVVTAAFHGFPDSMIRAVLPAAWEHVSPEEVIALHYASLPTAAARVFGDTVDVDELRRFGDLLAAVCADLDTSGRPLAAGNQTLELPEEPWARFWRAGTTWREYRGDGHISALVAADLTVVESLVLTAAWAQGRIDTNMLRLTRQVSDDAWAAGRDALVERGLMTSGEGLTDEGAALREGIEEQTDRASLRPWTTLSAADLTGLYRFFHRLSDGVITAGVLTPVTPVGAPWPPLPLFS